MKPDLPPSPDARLRWIETVSSFMDNKFRVPGTNFRFGLDPILGLIPVGGNAVSFAISAGLLVTMVKHGVSRKVLVLMFLNLALDATLGSIPVIGNIFDFFYKANQVNLNLLKKHYQEGKYAGNGNGIILAVVVGLLVVLGFLVYGTYTFLQYLVQQF